MGQIRDSILEKMLRSGLTIYQVSNMVRHRIPRRTVYAYLTGEKDTVTETASIIMDALGLTIKSKAPKAPIFESKIMNTRDYAIDIFVNDDRAYLRWLRRNPNGLVVNSYTHPSPEYLVMHHSTCWTISTPTRTNWTTTGYIKICSLKRKELEKWAEKEVGGRVRSCGICKP